MKKTIYIIMTAVAAAMAVGCSGNRITYNGPEYVMFSDTLYTVPVTSDDSEFEIPVVTMNSCNHDRTFAVEVIEKNSSAVEGVNYQILDNTLIVPAGERVAQVKVRADYESLKPEDELSFSLNLICDPALESPLKGTSTRVALRKCKAFNPQDFSGSCVISRCTWFDSYLPNLTQKLLKTEAKEDGTVVLKNFIYDGYDITLKLDTSNLLAPSVECEEQVFANTGEAFGTIYGDGKILMESPVSYPSYYNTFEKFVLLYMTMRVDGVGTVGTFGAIMEWISDDEFEALRTEGVPFN